MLSRVLLSLALCAVALGNPVPANLPANADGEPANLPANADGEPANLPANADGVPANLPANVPVNLPETGGQPENLPAPAAPEEAQEEGPAEPVVLPEVDPVPVLTMEQKVDRIYEMLQNLYNMAEKHKAEHIRIIKDSCPQPQNVVNEEPAEVIPPVPENKPVVEEQVVVEEIAPVEQPEEPAAVEAAPETNENVNLPVEQPEQQPEEQPEEQQPEEPAQEEVAAPEEAAPAEADEQEPAEVAEEQEEADEDDEEEEEATCPGNQLISECASACGPVVCGEAPKPCTSQCVVGGCVCPSGLPKWDSAQNLCVAECPSA